MSKQLEVLKLAREALYGIAAIDPGVLRICAVIDEALAEPKQEPVAFRHKKKEAAHFGPWVDIVNQETLAYWENEPGAEIEYAYTHPAPSQQSEFSAHDMASASAQGFRDGQAVAQWQELSDEDRQAVFDSLPDMLDGFLKKWGWLHFAKGIENKCREKNMKGTP